MFNNRFEPASSANQEQSGAVEVCWAHNPETVNQNHAL